MTCGAIPSYRLFLVATSVTSAEPIVQGDTVERQRVCKKQTRDRAKWSKCLLKRSDWEGAEY